MNKPFTTFGRIAAIFLAVSIVPILYSIWLFANPALVHNLWQTVNTISTRETPQGELTPLGDSVQAMSLFEQITAVIGGFVIKPVHMVLCLVVIWGLRHVKSKEMIALRWGLFFFWLGEAFCAVNYLVFNHESYFSEFLHSYGMVVGFAFTFYAVFEGLDRRLIQFTTRNKKCAAIELCGKCIKAQAVPCGARRIILLILPVMMVISMIPMAARLQSIRYQTDILGTIYTYDWPLLYQLTEARLAPMLALLLFAGAWVAMFLDRRLPVPDSARILASAGFGALSFGTLRFTLKTMFFENLIWADFWEELTELLFVLAVTAVFILFLQSLFQEAFPDDKEIRFWKILKPYTPPVTEADLLSPPSNK